MGVCCNASKEEQHQNIVIEKQKSFDPSKEVEAPNAPEIVQEENYKVDDSMTYNGQMKKFSENGVVKYIREGHGKVDFVGGGSYEGDWSGDKLNGRGTFTYPNGDVYTGDFVDDKANGYGVIVHVNGQKYEGYWVDDMREGQGKETLEDSSCYNGQFVQGMKEGFGVYQWAEGSSYSGDWKANMFHGEGEYQWTDSKCYQGGWLENKLNGTGVYTWPDGRVYEGTFSNDKKHGDGVYKWPNGNCYDGQWMDGVQHGIGKFTSKGKTKIGEWDNGKRIDWLKEDPRYPLPGMAFKLEYFNVHGRGSQVRMLLDYAKVANYQDCHVTFPEFGVKKPKGHYGMWGVMPMLTMPDGQKLSQTHGILRYLGNVYTNRQGQKMYPGRDDPELSYEIDSLMEAGDDLIYANHNFLSPMFTDAHARKNELLPIWLESQFGGFMARINTELENREEGCTGIFGTGITIADMYAASIIMKFLYNPAFDECDVHLETLKNNHPAALKYAEEELKDFIMEWVGKTPQYQL